MAKKEERITLREWLILFGLAEKNVNILNDLSEKTWWDWHCKDESLPNKTLKLGRMVRILAKSNRVNLDTTYVFFANHFPCDGHLYDTFSFSDIKTQDVIYYFNPRCGHTSSNGIAEIYWSEHEDMNTPLVQGTWIECRNFFLGKTVLNNDLKLVNA